MTHPSDSRRNGSGKSNTAEERNQRAVQDTEAKKNRKAESNEEGDGKSGAGEMEASATIPRARLSEQGVWSNPADGEKLAVEHNLWLPVQGPEARAFLSYTEDELQISMRAYEEEPLTRFSRHNDPVYKDSCLEFFLQPAPESDERYLNLEMNSAGTILTGLGAGRLDRVYLTADEVPPLHIRAETNQLDSATGKRYWSVSLRLPMPWLTELFPGFRPAPGTVMRGNFYKCGDETVQPHYGSWSLVRSDAPDFHRSADFGRLVLG